MIRLAHLSNVNSITSIERIGKKLEVRTRTERKHFSLANEEVDFPKVGDVIEYADEIAIIILQEPKTDIFLLYGESRKIFCKYINGKFVRIDERKDNIGETVIVKRKKTKQEKQIVQETRIHHYMQLYNLDRDIAEKIVVNNWAHAKAIEKQAMRNLERKKTLQGRTKKKTDIYLHFFRMPGSAYSK